MLRHDALRLFAAASLAAASLFCVGCGGPISARVAELFENRRSASADVAPSSLFPSAPNIAAEQLFDAVAGISR